MFWDRFWFGPKDDTEALNGLGDADLKGLSGLLAGNRGMDGFTGDLGPPA